MAKKTIFLDENYVQEEYDAGASGITPGMLVKLSSSNVAVVHATEGGDCEVMVVKEDSYQGNITSTAYTSGDPMFIGIPAPGGKFQGLLAAGQSVSIGDQLMSAGNGKWKAVADASSGVTAKPLAVARAALDLSGEGAVDTLVEMRRM